MSWVGRPIADCSTEQLASAKAAGFEPDGQYFVGRDPRRMTAAEIEALGHQRLSPLAVVRPPGRKDRRRHWRK